MVRRSARTVRSPDRMPSVALRAAAWEGLESRNRKGCFVTEMITIMTLDGDVAIPAYIAMPEGKPRGGIVVLAEVFGINRGIRAQADALAAAGYVVIAQDLFWRIAPGVERDPDVESHREAAIADMMKFDVGQGMADIEAVIRETRDRVGGRKVGVVGYCLGGRLAYLAAARTDADASVGYYGGGIDGALGEAHAIAHPILLHFAEQDHYISADALAKIHATLDGSPHVTIHDYPSVDHGFATRFGSRRDEAAAMLADQRTLAFFAEHLG